MGTNFYAIKSTDSLQEKQNKEKLESYLASFEAKKESASDYEKDLLDCLISAAHGHFTETPKIHIGKNSMGWTFTLNSSNFNSLAQLDQFLSENTQYLIIDEYGRTVSREDLQRIVENSKKNESEESKKSGIKKNTEGLSVLGGEWS